MAIYKRGNVYWIDFCFNRKRFRKRSPDNSYKGALAYELLIRQKLARGEALEEPKSQLKHTFKEVAIQWLEVYVKNNNKASEFISKRYVLNANLIPYFGEKYIEEINTYSIELYKNYFLKKAELSPKTINNYLCILSRCLRSAMEWEVIKEMPKIKLLKVPPQKYDYLTEAETEILLQHATGMWHDMILLAVRTGLRFGELIALKWEDINLKERILIVNKSIVRDVEGSPKNNKPRTVPLAPRVANMLTSRKRESRYVFHYINGSPLKYNICRYKLHEICKAAGLREINWHNLRHSFASHLAARHNSIVAVKELMGHSDIKTTMRYSHVNLPVLQSTIDTLEPSLEKYVTITSQPENKGSSAFLST